MFTNLIAPVALLICWTLIVLFWMVAKRFPAMKAMNRSVASPKARGGRGGDLEGKVPPEVMWPSHNYTHLLEQPTLFYATVLGLAILDRGTSLNVALAWSYVVLRIIHSVWQIKVNTIPVRLVIFVSSTMALVVLAINLLIAALAI
jgi:hypothetical protein